ncbi:MAG: hypothetical protein J2P24_17440 [Streptosporangiales bacterium]|nr:hypothetical protein [Streptosporangiales bacterium]
MTNRKLVGLVGTLATACLATSIGLSAAHADPSGSGSPNAQHYEIGLFGDMPYGDTGRAQYPNVLTDMNQHDLAFSAFDGDIKNGSEPCYADVDGSAQAAGKPDIYKYALQHFNTLRAPVVVVPGDNEWTDCDRPATAGPTFDAVQRLQYERQLFYPTDRTLGQRTMTLTRQSAAFPENVRWTFGPVTYVGLNVPGSNNDFIPDGDTSDGPQAEANAEYAARNAANLAWIHQSFAAAKADGSKAIMLVLQADMFGDSPANPAGTTADPTDHFADTKAALARESAAFGKPVVLVNGDSHFLTIDKPLTDDAGNVIMNVTRVMTFGSALNHWVSATVDPNDPQVFTFHQHVIAENVPTYHFNS